MATTPGDKWTTSVGADKPIQHQGGAIFHHHHFHQETRGKGKKSVQGKKPFWNLSRFHSSASWRGAAVIFCGKWLLYDCQPTLLYGSFSAPTGNSPDFKTWFLRWKQDNELWIKRINDTFTWEKNEVHLNRVKVEIKVEVFGGVSLREGPYFPQTIFHWS